MSESEETIDYDDYEMDTWYMETDANSKAKDQWKIQKQTKKRKITLNAKNATTAPILKLIKIHPKENWLGEISITNKFQALQKLTEEKEITIL